MSNDSTVYRIAKWDEVFERAESRKLKTLTWVSVPTSFTSSGYQCMLDEFQDTAPAIYGAWCALVAIAASCTVRGSLCNSRGTPLPTTHLARISGFPRQIFDELIAWASRPEIGWLVPSSDAEISEKLRENDTSGDRRGIVGGSSGEIPDYQTRPDQTRPDQTRPNHTQPDQAGVGVPPVVGGGGDLRILGRGEFDAVARDAVVDLAKRLQTALPFTLPGKRLGLIARAVLAAGIRSEVLELAHLVGMPGVRVKSRYWAGGLRKAAAERGVDFDASLAVLEGLAEKQGAATA